MRFIFKLLLIPLVISACESSQQNPIVATTEMKSTDLSFETEFKDASGLESFKWLYEPAVWSVKEGFNIQPDSGSDFWQRTHYGFRNDNAHFYYTEIEGDFEMTATVQVDPKHRYDQAGLCVRLDEDNWIKTSAEYETAQIAHLGAVVTNLGYSDWSTQEIPVTVKELEYKMIRKGQDFEIYTRHSGLPFQQIRIAHLHKSAPKINAGIYACSPTAEGYSAVFKKFAIKPVK